MALGILQVKLIVMLKRVQHDEVSEDMKLICVRTAASEQNV